MVVAPGAPVFDSPLDLLPPLNTDRAWLGRTTSSVPSTSCCWTAAAEPLVVDVEELGRFADNGNGICAEPDSERYVNGVTSSDRLGDSFHPTVPGYVRLAQDLLARIGSVV